jgi:predicted small lipoprotein YifL
MKKRLLALVLICTMAFSLSACGKKEDKAETKTESQPTTSNPKTGDNILVYVAMFMLSTTVLIYTIKKH